MLLLSIGMVKKVKNAKKSMVKREKKRSRVPRKTSYVKISSTPSSALKAKNFLPAYLAMQRPNTTHLFLSKGLADFLLGLIVGTAIGLVISVYLN